MIKFIFGLIIGLVCVVFFFQNGDISNVHFLKWTLSLPHFLIMLIFFIFGIFFGWLFTRIKSLKKGIRNKAK